MFDWIKRIFTPEPTAIKLLVPGPVRAHAERLNDSLSLHMSGTAHVEGDEGTTADFTIVIHDTQSLRDLCGMMNAIFRREEADDPFVDEPANIYNDIQATFGRHYAKKWIQDPNLHLGGKTPHEVIRAGEPYRVRQILRQAKHGKYS